LDVLPVLQRANLAHNKIEQQLDVYTTTDAMEDGHFRLQNGAIVVLTGNPCLLAVSDPMDIEPEKTENVAQVEILA
jgi:hypothetical protein